MFSHLVKVALDWKPEPKKKPNERYRLTEADERCILRMAQAGYSAWETQEILGSYNYSTIAKIFKKHGFKERGDWV